MKSKRVWISLGVAVAAFVIFGPLDAYAGTGGMLVPFLPAATRVKVRAYAAPIGIGAGLLAWHFLR